MSHAQHRKEKLCLKRKMTKCRNMVAFVTVRTWILGLGSGPQGRLYSLEI